MRLLLARQGALHHRVGAEANRSGPVDEKGTYEFQSDLLRYHLDTYRQKNAFINGAIVWILRDFHMQPGWDGGNPKPSPPGGT